MAGGAVGQRGGGARAGGSPEDAIKRRKTEQPGPGRERQAVDQQQGGPKNQMDELPPRGSVEVVARNRGARPLYACKSQRVKAQFGDDHREKECETQPYHLRRNRPNQRVS